VDATLGTPYRRFAREPRVVQARHCGALAEVHGELRVYGLG
jgi:hypothetical protein